MEILSCFAKCSAHVPAKVAGSSLALTPAALGCKNSSMSGRATIAPHGNLDGAIIKSTN
jgi:hypothetical protein